MSVAKRCYFGTVPAKIVNGTCFDMDLASSIRNMLCDLYLQPRYSNPTIAKNEVVETDESHSSPLSCGVFIRDIDHDHKN